MRHLNAQKLFDGDSVFLNGQGRLLQANKPRGAQGQGSSPQQPAWATAYFMPMSCDRAVVAARKWIDSVGRGGPSYATEAAPEAHQVLLPRAALLGAAACHVRGAPCNGLSRRLCRPWGSARSSCCWRVPQGDRCMVATDCSNGRMR
jgi:hypothetical protein